MSVWYHSPMLLTKSPTSLLMQCSHGNSGIHKDLQDGLVSQPREVTKGSEDNTWIIQGTGKTYTHKFTGFQNFETYARNTFEIAGLVSTAKF